MEANHKNGTDEPWPASARMVKAPAGQSRLTITNRLILLIILPGLCLIAFLSLRQAGAAAADYTRTGLIEITDNGGRIDWSPNGAKIFFDRREANGFYDLWRMNPDGTSQECLTCDHPGLPNNHQGQPALSPDGRYMVFQAEKLSHPGTIGSLGNEPGNGTYNDLWVMDLSNNAVYRLVNLPVNRLAGTLHPHFSHSGTKLLWSDMEGEAPAEPGMCFVTLPWLSPTS